MPLNTYNTLYLCYFGLREPLVQTQVLPYLREITKDGIKVFLLTFEANPREKWTNIEIEETRKTLADEGIFWDFRTYHKRPSAPATLFDVLVGAFYAWRLIRRENIDVLHSRVHVPAMMSAVARKFSRRKPKILFDIRGFFPEEYTDAGHWKENGLLYKLVKRVEKWLFKEADAFVVLTEKARQILFPESAATGFDRFERPVEVIPCCVDLDKFKSADEQARREIRHLHNLENRYVITYIGSIGTWYLADEMADLMQSARELNNAVFALILTQSDPGIMEEKLRKRGFTAEDLLVKKVSHKEIPRYLSASDVAISFIKACYSKQSSSPTKIAEYLASGVPIVTNRGVGDVAEQIEVDKSGAVVEDFSRESYAKALQTLKHLQKNSDLSAKCRQSARERFDLERVGGAKYRLLYKKILGSKL